MTYSEIKDLLQKQQITGSLTSLAHEVRLSGNDAAHPETLEDVDPEQARESLEFLDEFLQTTIVVPERVQQRAEARKRTP